jgi:ribosomal protein S18 acetylase RimI-like enzyme
MRHKIEPMSITDYDEVFALWQSAEGVGLGESDTRPAIAAYLKRNPGMSFVARHGRELAGAVLCGEDGRRGYLHHLAVVPSYRRQGLGRKLVAACLATLKQRGILKCNIFLYAHNSTGKQFWNKNGWAKRPDIVLMQKTLAPASRKPRRCR